MIRIENVSFSYEKTKKVLSNISLNIKKGSFVGITGPTGSGKSTLVKILSGLLKPSEGSVFIDDEDICNIDYLTLRKKVGIVFQFPESQLFEETVLKDVAFGPKNLMHDEKLANEYAKKALSLVSIDESCYNRSPFNLSGGQKRSVAIAGVLAMDTEILILDEPAAGLDPRAKNEIFYLLKNLNDQGKTIILISHSMEDIASYCSHLIVFDSLGLVCFDTTKKAFEKNDVKPFSLRIASKLGLCAFSINELVDEISKIVLQK